MVFTYYCYFSGNKRGGILGHKEVGITLLQLKRVEVFKKMKFLIGLYVVMAVMVFVNLTSEYIFKGEYSAIASSVVVLLFLIGTIFYVNARHDLQKK